MTIGTRQYRNRALTISLLCSRGEVCSGQSIGIELTVAFYRSGRGLGGTSQINWMIWTVPQREEIEGMSGAYTQRSQYPLRIIRQVLES